MSLSFGQRPETSSTTAPSPGQRSELEADRWTRQCACHVHGDCGAASHAWSMNGDHAHVGVELVAAVELHAAAGSPRIACRRARSCALKLDVTSHPQLGIAVRHCQLRCVAQLRSRCAWPHLVATVPRRNSKLYGFSAIRFGWRWSAQRRNAPRASAVCGRRVRQRTASECSLTAVRARLASTSVTTAALPVSHARSMPSRWMG